MSPPEDHNPPGNAGRRLANSVQEDADPVIDVEEGKLPTWQPLKLSARHLMMIELHLQGFKNTEIAGVMHCHEVTVGLVLRSQPAQDMLRERVEHVNLDFQAQFRQVVDTLADAHDPQAAIDIRLKAADMWLKAHGHYQPKPQKGASGKLTIEDVISEMKAGTVTINVDNRKQTYYSAQGRDEGDERWQEDQPRSATLKEGSPPEQEVLPKAQGRQR